MMLRNLLLPVVSYVLLTQGDAFAPVSVRQHAVVERSTISPLKMMTLDPSVSMDVVSAVSSTSTIHLAETEAWVQPAATFLDPFLNILSFAMLARVVLSWYPETKISEMPWVLVAVPTEPLLRAVKGVIPPAFGVDITPVFWVAVFTFVHEILLGQQGLLTMKIKYGI